ncbi:MAG: histidine kinase, partial [Halobacteriaceae archaeon]
MSEGRLPNSLTGFIDRAGKTEWSIQLVNQTTSAPLERMLDKLFDGLAIETTEIDLPEAADDLVVLVHDGEVVASSPLSILKDTLLMVNSDLYKTGTRGIQDINPPDIIMELSDTVFTLRGYPESDTEKLVLTLVSRYIEYQAWSHETG